MIDLMCSDTGCPVSGPRLIVCSEKYKSESQWCWFASTWTFLFFLSDYVSFDENLYIHTNSVSFKL